jgi:hypothetical protein
MLAGPSLSLPGECATRNDLERPSGRIANRIDYRQNVLSDDRQLNRGQSHDCKPPVREILFCVQSLIARQQDFYALFFCSPKQLTILQAGPTHMRHGYNFVIA